VRNGGPELKRFEFSLQAVHDFRELRRENAERAFAEAMNELARARTALETIESQRVASTNDYLSLLESGELDAGLMASHIAFIDELRRRESNARLSILEIEAQAKHLREKLTDALRDTEATAKLREQQLEQHQSDVARNEQKILDEMAVVASTRRRDSKT
jgi:flagellar export protein FliJ